jgi:hypothetical protein
MNPTLAGPGAPFVRTMASLVSAIETSGSRDPRLNSGRYEQDAARRTAAIIARAIFNRINTRPFSVLTGETPLFLSRALIVGPVDVRIVKDTEPIPQILDLPGIGESGKQLLSDRPHEKRVTF